MTTIDATVAQLMGRVNLLVNAESHLASGPLIWGKVYDEKKVPIFKMRTDLEAALRAALTEAQPVPSVSEKNKHKPKIDLGRYAGTYGGFKKEQS